MRAIVVRGINDWALEELPGPRPGPGEVLVAVTITGLCRTDLKIVEQGHRDLVLPRIPGEEVVGRVIATGDGVDQPACGQRVYVYPGTSCGTCPQCRSGAGNLCRGMRIMGFHRNGGFADEVAVPASTCLPLPDALDDEVAIFAEPLSCCLNALELARLSRGELLGVWGAGPAGQLLRRAGLARGARVTVVEPHPLRRESVSGSASGDGLSLDVAAVSVGDPAAYREALGCLGPRGRLVVFSGLKPASAQLPIDINRLHYHEQTLVGAYGCSLRHSRKALDLLVTGEVPVRDLISHRLPLADLATGLAIVAGRAGMKVLLYP